MQLTKIEGAWFSADQDVTEVRVVCLRTDGKKAVLTMDAQLAVGLAASLEGCAKRAIHAKEAGERADKEPFTNEMLMEDNLDELEGLFP